MGQYRLIQSVVPEGGTVAMYAAFPLGPRVAPLVVVLHGALRDFSFVEGWADRLTGIADVLLVEMPGHGRSTPILPARVEALADGVLWALKKEYSSRDILLVGESLGGLVALMIGGRADRGPVQAILAADPPMTTAKLWGVVKGFSRAVARNPTSEFLRSLAFEAFGLTATDTYERIYYPVVGELKVPTVIVTGDVKLLPPRNTDRAACIFDDVDRFVVETHYPGKVEVRQLANTSHFVLEEAHVACREIIDEMVCAHLGADSDS